LLKYVTFVSDSTTRVVGWQCADKTTLLSEWLRTTPRLSAWLALDEHDNDPVTFLTYLLAAISTNLPSTLLGWTVISIRAGAIDSRGWKCTYRTAKMEHRSHS